MRLMGGDQSLNATIARPARTPGRTFWPTSGRRPEEIVTGRPRQQAALALAGAVAGRAQRARAHDHPASGGCARTARTLEELGVRLGISKERVRQIEHRALQKLKSSLLQRSVEPRDSLPSPETPRTAERPRRGQRAALGRTGLLRASALAGPGPPPMAKPGPMPTGLEGVEPMPDSWAADRGRRACGPAARARARAGRPAGAR